MHQKFDIVNLTPHSLNLYCEDKIVTRIPPSGTIARITETRRVLNSISDKDGNVFPVTCVCMNVIENLPEQRPGVLFVVSLPLRLAANALGRFEDVVSPFDEVRDAKGSIIGMRSLARGED